MDHQATHPERMGSLFHAQGLAPAPAEEGTMATLLKWIIAIVGLVLVIALVLLLDMFLVLWAV